MEICITGGGGFIGSHLVADLAGSGDPVRLLLRRPPAHPAAGVTAVIGDLRDPGVMRRLIVPGSTVVHLAYLSAASREENLVVARHLAAACQECRASRLLHLSTAVVAGRARERVITEETPCRPRTRYERTKLEIEGLLLGQLADLCPVTVLRPTAVFGPGGSNLAKMVAEAAAGRRWQKLLKAILLSDRRLHLVCVENVVAAIRFLLAVETTSSEQFIVSDDGVPENNYRDLAAIVAAELGQPPPPRVPLPLRAALLGGVLRLLGRSDTDPQRIYSDRKLQRRGFTKPMALLEGVRRYARWYAGAVAPARG